MKFAIPILALLLAAKPVTQAALVEIQYQLDTGSASIDPFTIPDPNSGADFTISPSLNIESGSFTAIFQSDEFGTISDGDADIIDFQFIGALDIEVSTVITIIFPVTVSANLVGPLTGTQVTDSSGTLAGLSAYLEGSVGNYDTVAGPLDCEDSLGGLACGGIETALGIEFPITQVAGDDAPLPFTGGVFADLNGTAPSSAGSTLDLSVPIDDTNSFGFAVNFTWDETGRLLVVPEPSAVTLLGLGALALLRRRR